MAEQVVEAVGLLQVVELIGATHPPGDRKAPVREVFEEHAIGHEARHRDDLPARCGHQLTVHVRERGHAIGRQVDLAEPGDERVACAPAQQRRLARIELLPHRVVDAAVTLQRLVDGEIGAGFEARIELLLQFRGDDGGHETLGMLWFWMHASVERSTRGLGAKLAHIWDVMR